MILLLILLLKDRIKMQISIKKIDFFPIKVPVKKMIKTKEKMISHLICCVCIIKNHDGLIGQGFTYHINLELLELLINFFKERFSILLSNQKVFSLVEIQKKLVRCFPKQDYKYYHYILSAIDIALWDLIAQEKQLQLSHLLDVSTTQVPVYGSGGWLSYSDSELINECQYYADQGVTSYKFKIGGFRDEKRIALLRKEMGDEFKLFVDANQSYELNEALKIISILNEYGIEWFEEPIINDNVNELARLAQFIKNNKLEVATGENIFRYDLFETLLVNNAATIIQPDIVRCGGISGFLRIGKLVDFYNLKLTSHLNHEISVSVLPAFKTGYLVEHMDLFPDDCFTHRYAINKGTLEIPNAIGTGVRFTNASLRKYTL